MSSTSSVSSNSSSSSSSDTTRHGTKRALFPKVDEPYKVARKRERSSVKRFLALQQVVNYMMGFLSQREVIGTQRVCKDWQRACKDGLGFRSQIDKVSLITLRAWSGKASPVAYLKRNDRIYPIARIEKILDGQGTLGVCCTGNFLFISNERLGSREVIVPPFGTDDGTILSMDYQPSEDLIILGCQQSLRVYDGKTELIDSRQDPSGLNGNRFVKIFNDFIMAGDDEGKVAIWNKRTLTCLSGGRIDGALIFAEFLSSNKLFLAGSKGVHLFHVGYTETRSKLDLKQDYHMSFTEPVDCVQADEGSIYFVNKNRLYGVSKEELLKGEEEFLLSVFHPSLPIVKSGSHSSILHLAILRDVFLLIDENFLILKDRDDGKLLNRVSLRIPFNGSLYSPKGSHWLGIDGTTVMLDNENGDLLRIDFKASSSSSSSSSSSANSSSSSSDSSR